MKQSVKILIVIVSLSIFLGILLLGIKIGKATNPKVNTEESQANSKTNEVQEFFNKITVIKKISKDNIIAYLVTDGATASCSNEMAGCYIIIKKIDEKSIAILKEIGGRSDLSNINDLEINKVKGTESDRYYLEYSEIIGDGATGSVIQNRMDLSTGEVQILSDKVCDWDKNLQKIYCYKTLYSYTFFPADAKYQILKKCRCEFIAEGGNNCTCE
jgi:hypothetical protein